MRIIAFLVVLIFPLLSISEELIDLTIGEPKKINAEDLKREAISGEIYAGGTFTTECRLEDYRNLYAEKNAFESATRDYSEAHIKLYGIANGVGPIYPGKTCPNYEQYHKVVLWPTKNCEYNLAYEAAYTYAKIYNNQVFELLCN